MKRLPTLRLKKRVYQKSGDGLCFTACVASLLGLELEDVPCFWTDDKGMSCSAKEWLKRQGYVWWELKWDREDLGTQHEPVPAIVTGKSPRGVMHAIICEFFTMNGFHALLPLHDPHPSGAGIKEPLWMGFLLPLHSRITPVDLLTTKQE